jgi:VanZ family protein
VFAWLLVGALRAAGLAEQEYGRLAWIYGTSYGLLIEMIQALVPWRSADLADAAANALGAAIGVWLGRRIPRPLR